MTLGRLRGEVGNWAVGVCQVWEVLGVGAEVHRKHMSIFKYSTRLTQSNAVSASGPHLRYTHLGRYGEL